MEKDQSRQLHICPSTHIAADGDIDGLIYEIRGQAVMLDSDLAKLYECANGTKTINQAVKRNPERFPSDFCFRLTEEEFLNLKSQNGTANPNRHGGVRKNPYVFTEQGVAMLASIIRTSIAAQASVSIMRAFVMMRKYLSANLLEQKYINNLVIENRNKIKLLEDSFDAFRKVEQDHTIYFDGQVYDAYSKIQNILSVANKEAVIIDGYADNTLLDIIKRLKCKITVITMPNKLLTLQDILKYNEQYDNLTVKYSKAFHDRYFILDNKIVYHCGTSVNRIGRKVFSITKVNDGEICNLLLDKIATL